MPREKTWNLKFDPLEEGHEMHFDKRRKRRLIYNDDADQVYSDFRAYDYKITDVQSFLDTRTTPAFGTHADTYVWCVGNGADPPWGVRGGTLWPFIGTYDRAGEIIVEACHREGMEVWGSLRMNDTHDAFGDHGLDQTAEPIKAEHPEYLIAPEKDRHLPAELTERLLWTALNYAHPEVRDYRLNYIEKNASAHDFDGYELDFSRFSWFFRFGKERECAHFMTDFVREVRRVLDEIAKKRARPYTLVVHLPDSPLASLDLGLDIKAWLDEKLVDVIIAGMGYLVYNFDLVEWKALARPYGVPVYPSINAAIFTKKYVQLPEGPKVNESIRATCSYWWQEGVDGICPFNLFTLQDPYLGGFSREYTFELLPEVGDPRLMKGKDKVYGIQPSSDRSTLQQASEATCLPIALDTNEHELPLNMGPDAEDDAAKIEIHALTRGGDADTKVWFRLNHTLLEPEKRDEWHSVVVPRGVMRPGRNKLAIWCNKALAEAEAPTIVRRVAVTARYS